MGDSLRLWRHYKNIHWKINQLFVDSPYADPFNNGIFMHAFLGSNGYHRQHAPVGGTVLEPYVIHRQVQFEVITQVDDSNGSPHLKLNRTFDVPDHAGYPFLQARDPVVLETATGLAAGLPIGMAQVSSLIRPAEVGKTLRKAEKLSYFLFEGNDIILVFEAKSNVGLTT